MFIFSFVISFRVLVELTHQVSASVIVEFSPVSLDTIVSISLWWQFESQRLCLLDV
jgi:hypothetical protein